MLLCEMNYKSYFDSIAPNWLKYRRQHSYYWRELNKFVGFYMSPDSSVLEVGCATGEALAMLPGRRKVGIDFCESLVEQGRKIYGDQIEFHVMDAQSISLDEKFDVIFLSNLVTYLPDVETVLNQLRPLCHPQTRLIVTNFNKLWEPAITLAELVGIKRRCPQQNWLSVEDMKGLLYLAGFETYRINSSMLMPLNIPIFSYLLNRFVAHMPLMGSLSLNHFLFARPRPSDEDGWQRRYSVTVVVPARNESGNIHDAIERIPDMGSHTEIIFVEGNSTDDTWDVIQREAKASSRDIKYMQQDGRGKGDAVRKGYAAASGDILMILDADLTVPPEDLPKFYKAIATGKGEFINGVRLVYPMEKGSMRFLNTIGNHFFSRLFSWILETPVKDTLCGTKVMFREDYLRLAAGRAFFGEFDPFGDFDLLFGAHKLNLKITDLPIRYRERTYGDTNISRFRHGFLLLQMSAFAALKIRFR